MIGGTQTLHTHLPQIIQFVYLDPTLMQKKIIIYPYPFTQNYIICLFGPYLNGN
jgi:hypothetical protein